MNWLLVFGLSLCLLWLLPFRWWIREQRCVVGTDRDSFCWASAVLAVRDLDTSIGLRLRCFWIVPFCCVRLRRFFATFEHVCSPSSWFPSSPRSLRWYCDLAERSGQKWVGLVAPWRTFSGKATTWVSFLRTSYSVAWCCKCRSRWGEHRPS